MIVSGHHRWNSISRVTNPRESPGRSRASVVPRAAPRLDAERDDDDDASTSDRVGDARRETRGAFDDAFDVDAFDGDARRARGVEDRGGSTRAGGRRGRVGEAVTCARCARTNERVTDDDACASFV